jgi:hypothetical protein
MQDAVGAGRPGYEMVIATQEGEQIERFENVAEMLAREHELLSAWKALGRRDTSAPPRQRER